jgi:Protein of unknown function (DUF3800)
MLKSYMDESGIHEQAKHCVIAGYVASTSAWKTFEKAWRRILAKAGHDEFHAQRFFSRDPQGNCVGPYAGWSLDQADAFLNRLLATIKSCDLYALGSIVNTDLFRSFSLNQRRFLTGGEFRGSKWLRSGAPSKPYYLPFHHCVTEAAHRCAEGAKVHFFFDRNEQLSNWALALYRRLAQYLEVRERLGDIAFPNSRDALPLQAADLLCHAVRSQIDSTNAPATSEWSYVLRNAMKRGGRVWCFDEPVLRKLVEKCPT